jgi:hypothetical protein
MKMKNSLLIAGLTASASLFSSCGDNAPKGDTATIQQQQQTTAVQGIRYAVDTSASRIRFVGHGVGKNHPGYSSYHQAR